MKLKLLLLFIPALLLITTAAYAQSSLPSQVQIVQVPEHPLHAEPHAMATERPIVGGGADTYTYAHGEQPLWEFPNPTETKSLGEIARDYRQQKLQARKASLVMEQIGDKQ